MIREDVYRKNLKIILAAIKDRNIQTAERMIKEEIRMSEKQEQQEDKKGRKSEILSS